MEQQNQFISSDLPQQAQVNFQPNHGDEINLFHYLLIIWKRKWLILGVFIFILAAAIAKIMVMPPVFQSTAIIEIGHLDKEPIESVNDLDLVFKDELMLREVAKKLGLANDDAQFASLAKSFFITEDVESKSHFTLVYAQGDTPNAAKSIAQAVTDLIIERHKKLFNTAKEMFDYEITLLNRDHEKAKQDIVRLKKEISRLDPEIKNYKNEINKRATAVSDAQGRITESYLALWQEAKKTKTAKEVDLTNLEYSIKNFDVALFQKNYQFVQNSASTTIESAPKLPINKIAPKRRPLAIQSGIIALFISFLSAFVTEYIVRHKNKLRELNATKSLNQKQLS